jgi:integrase
MKVPKISKRTVDALHAVGGKPTFLWDEQLHGFGVKALPSGVKKYVVKYRTSGGGRAAPQRWLTLGTHGQITPDQARSLAQQALAGVARGEDPQASKFALRTAPTLQDVWDRFAEEHLPQKKPATRQEYASQWRHLLSPKFGKTKVETIGRGEIDKFHKAMRETPYRANRTLALLARLMSLAEAWDWRAPNTNPCKHVERFSEQPRTRFLTVPELERIGEAIKQLVNERAITETAANAIELLLLTGARLNEILKAEWSWVDMRRGLLSLPDSKTGAKPVYLGAAATTLLKQQKANAGGSAYIFPSPDGEKSFVNLRKSWLRICQRAKLDSVRLHDLRHTAATIAVGKGATLAVIGRLLGHSQAQTTLRYAHVDIDPALNAANDIGRVVNSALGRRHGPSAEKGGKAKRRKKTSSDFITITS